MTIDHQQMKNIALLIHESSALLKREFERAAKPQQLTLMQWRVLVTLLREGPMKQVALGGVLNASPMSISDVAERLCAAGLVRREPDPEDSRAKLVALTEKGETKSQHMRAVAEGVFDKTLRGVAPEDVEALMRALTRIVDNLEGS